MKVAVTGGRGRVARALERELGSRWEVERYSREGGRGGGGEREVFALDRLWEGGVLDGVDAVIHAAWSVLPASAEGQCGAWDEQDRPLLERLLGRLAGCGRPPLLVFMSTGAVYGEAPGRPSREGDPARAKGAYARGKRRAEEMIEASGVRHVILRVSNLYGLESAEGEGQGVVPAIVRCGLAGAPFRRWGADTCKDYLHRRDFAAAMCGVVEGGHEGLWNVGSGVGTRISELVGLIGEEMGVAIAIEGGGDPLAWDVEDNRLDTGGLERLMGWRARVGLREGIRELLAGGGSGTAD